MNVPKRLDAWVRPVDAMSALDPEFIAAYRKAADAMLTAVLEFEKTTRRVVASIDLELLNVNSLEDAEPSYLRQCALHFLPLPGETLFGPSGAMR